MPLDPRHVGRTYGPYTYTLGVYKLREFALVVGGGVPGIFVPDPRPPPLAPFVWDEAAAAAGPHGSLIALPTFAAVFAMVPFGRAVVDPELGIDLTHVLHGEQELELLRPLRPGDVMTTTGRIASIQHKAGKAFMVVRTESLAARGVPVVLGAWTAVILR